MPPGRPPTERKTDQTRVFEDQVDKLKWLFRLKGVTSAEFIGPRIERDLEAEFEKIRPLVEQLTSVSTQDLGEAGA